MIDWDKTYKKFGYKKCDKTKKVIVVCNGCSADVEVTKNRFYCNKRRNGGKYQCFECSKKVMSEKASVGIKNKWKDPEYRKKQEGRKHSDDLKKQARERSTKLWSDPMYIEKYKAGFNPDVARENLDRARSKGLETVRKNLKNKWKDKSYRSKMSEQSLLLWQDEQYRNKVIANYKSSLNERSRQKMSEAAKRAWRSDEYRKNWLVSFLDSFTDDRRLEIGIRSAKQWADPKYRAKIEDQWDDDKRRWMADICRDWWTDERRSAVSELMLERWSDDEWRNKCIQAFLASWTDERRQAARDWWTDERRQAASERSRLLWKDPEYVKKFIDLLGRPSSLENQFASILRDYNVEFEQQVHIGPYLFDFQIGDILVEIQGDYWHRLERTVAKDKSKATYIDRYFPNLKLLYLWEHEFYELEKVRHFVESIVGGVNVIDFSFDDVIVDFDVLFDDAGAIFEKYHYKSNIGRGGLIIGARLGFELIACCVFSNPTRNVIGGELTRFVIHPRYQKKNFASWFLSRATKFALDKFGYLFTFADPNFNHYGTVYLASNWSLVGESRSDYWYVGDGGWVMHKKTLWNRAKNLCMREGEFANIFGYSKVWGLPKVKYEKRKKG